MANFSRRINGDVLKSAFVGGILLALGQLLFDHTDPLCWQWHCLRHYIWILVAGGVRSAWEYMKVPLGTSGKEVHNNDSKSASAGR